MEKSVLELSFSMGSILLENGAEISRVQETMERVARTLGNDLNVYVLTNAIFASGEENGKTHSTELKFIKNSKMHLGRISAINQLSRDIESGKLDIDAAYSETERIRKIPYTPLPMATMCCALVAGCFSIIFGGNLLDALAAAICGAALEPLIYLLDKRGAAKFLSNLFLSAIVAALALLLIFIGIGNNPDKVIIGTIMRLVPGIALTNSIRDFLGGDYLSGTIRLIDALIIGVCIGIGVGFVISVSSMITGGVFI